MTPATEATMAAWTLRDEGDIGRVAAQADRAMEMLRVVGASRSLVAAEVLQLRAVVASDTDRGCVARGRRRREICPPSDPVP